MSVSSGYADGATGLTHEPPTLPGVLVLVGGALVALGSVLPWATVSAPFVGTVSVNGTHGDGAITLALGVLLALCAAVDLSSQRHPGRPTALLAATIGGIAIYDAVRVHDTLSSVNGSQLVSASVGTGLWVAIAGAVVALAGARIGRHSR